jgi:CheY-like chemotaxis protein
MGHAPRVAHNGEHALEQARDVRPNVVFIDIGMPGMDGYDIARALRQTPGLERIRLVALTGWGAESDRVRSREAGFDDHLTKPANLATVQKVLSDLARPPDEQGRWG